MDKLLTITVPAYNAENYLEKCIDSMLIANEEQRAALDIIIVNDGSVDNTRAIGERYQKRHSECIRLINKENGGHGSGINRGIGEAEGRYFKVVDADDWVDTWALQQLLELIRSFEAHTAEPPDIIASDFVTIRDGSLDLIKKWPATPDVSQYGKIVQMADGQIKDCIKMHHMSIRTEILRQVGRNIDEHCFYVDMEYITYPIPHVQTVYYDNHTLYQYRLGRAGQTMSMDVMKQNRARHRYVMEQLLSYYDETKDTLSASHRKYMEVTIGKMMESHFQIYICMGTDKTARRQLREWDQQLKVRYPGVYAATAKRSIWLLRKSDYCLLPIAYIAYSLLKKR